jgi:hypothetical protein
VLGSLAAHQAKAARARRCCRDCPVAEVAVGAAPGISWPLVGWRPQGQEAQQIRLLLQIPRVMGRYSAVDPATFLCQLAELSIQITVSP